MKYCRVLLVHCLVKASTAWEHKPNISTNGEDKRSSLRNSKHFDRDLWQFEQDDMFMQLTTAVPTISDFPTISPAPSDSPSISANPTNKPSASPSSKPSLMPSGAPTPTPTGEPTSNPSLIHSLLPSKTPTLKPSFEPTSGPSISPTLTHSVVPSSEPSVQHSSEPSSLPSLYPSPRPSVKPSISPSVKPSMKPSTIPTKTPSQLPSQKPSLSPSYVPSMTPTTSKAPSNSPSTSLAPSLVISTTQISRFTIVLTSSRKSPAIDIQEVIDIAEDFLDSYLDLNLPKYLRYRGVDIQLAETNRRKLQRSTTIPCIGELRFNLFASPDSIMINNHVSTAFNSFKDEFYDHLKNEGSDGLQSLLDVNTKDSRVQNDFSSMHIMIIVVCASIVVTGVAASYIWKRTQQNNVRKRLLRAAEYSRHFKVQPKLDDDCFKDIEPQPIQILDDNKALERMVMRARHDRGVMNRANEYLVHQVETVNNKPHAQRDVRFASAVYQSNEIPTEVHALSLHEDDEYYEQIGLCSSPFSNASTSRGGSVTTDKSSLINIGYNDIESNERTNNEQQQNYESQAHSEDASLSNPLNGSGLEGHGIPVQTTANDFDGNNRDERTISRGNLTQNANQSEGSAFFTSQLTRQY